MTFDKKMKVNIQIPLLFLAIASAYGEPEPRKPVMSELPEDIRCRIIETFSEPEIQLKVTESLENLRQINVGQDQLRRAIVFLADGDYERFKELRRSFLGDPRDSLCEANRRLVNRDYWFSTPFDDMGPVKD